MPSTTGVNESTTYSYSYAESEKIRQIMAHKEEKLRQEEESEHLKDDLNRDILEEADQEEAIGGAVTAEASPLSLLSTGSAIPYSSMGTAAPTTISMSAGPVWGGSAAPAGRVPTAIVNGQPVYSNNPGDPFGGTLRAPSARPMSRVVSAAPMQSVSSSAAPIWPVGMSGSAVPYGY